MPLTATRRVSLVWLVLVVATVASLLIGSRTSEEVDAGTLATAVVLGIAFFKVRLIGLHFMEIATAPMPLRVVFEGYCAVVLIGLVVLEIAV